MPKLGRNELQELLAQVEDSFPHGECNTCECFLGYLAQLRIDSDSGDNAPPALRAPSPNPQEETAMQSDVELRIWGGLGRGKVDRKDMHHCLGCDPCPPGDLYAEYMKKKQLASQ